MEQIKPVVEVLQALLGWRGRVAEMPLLTKTVERIKAFFELMRRKLYIGGRIGTSAMTARNQRDLLA